MVSFKQTGDFSKTSKYLKRLSKFSYSSTLEKYGQRGVEALAAATPVNTGTTAASWYYEIERERDHLSLVFKNGNVVNGVPIAIILQYGHGTRNGGYVQGRDYINPAVRPIFDELAQTIWKEVTAL